MAIDPANVYAHTMWGFWITWTHGKLDDAREHFTAALASGRQRPYVRVKQLVAMQNLGGDAGDVETLRIAHEMWEKKEPIPQDRQLQIRDIYTSACGTAHRNEVDKLVKAITETEHIVLIRNLFPLSDSPRDRTYWVQPCLANIRLKTRYGASPTTPSSAFRLLPRRPTKSESHRPTTQEPPDTAGALESQTTT